MKAAFSASLTASAASTARCGRSMASMDTGWLNNVRIVGLWTIDQDRNAWVYVRDAAGNNIGWKRIAADNDNIFYAMLTDSIAAKAAARPVNLYVEQGVVKQIYVL